MNVIKAFLGGIFLCILEAAVGVLLLIDPVSFTSWIIIGCGAVLILWGLGCGIHYFRTEAEEAAESQSLMKGLVLAVLGIFCVLKSEWFLATFSMMTILYGLVILVSGIGKIQWAVDMLRVKKPRWFLAAISAVLSIICALVILRSPFASTEVLWRFTGIALICEALLDIVTFFISGAKKARAADGGSGADVKEKEKV